MANHRGDSVLELVTDQTKEQPTCGVERSKQRHKGGHFRKVRHFILIRGVLLNVVCPDQTAPRDRTRTRGEGAPVGEIVTSHNEEGDVV